MFDKEYQSICGRTFAAYDIFACDVLREHYSCVVKEIAANILRFVAWDVNHFSAQHLVEDVIKAGIEPLLKKLLGNDEPKRIFENWIKYSDKSEVEK